MSEDRNPQRTYTIDTGRRLRRRIALGAGAAVVAVIVALVVINATGGDEASGEAVGTDVKIAFNSAFASEQRLLEYVASDIAPDYGLEVEAVSLADPQQIDRSVSDGIVAGTIYEHKHWMESQIDSGGFKVTAVQPIYKWAFGVYSDKYSSIEELPQGATIGVPDDPSNQSQALWLLDREGLITLDPSVDPWSAQLSDVEENPNDYDLKPLGLAVMPRALGSIDAGISYVDFFDSADVPASKSILSTPPPDEFDAQLVVGTDHTDDPNVQKLMELWKDPRIQEYLEESGAPALFPVAAQS